MNESSISLEFDEAVAVDQELGYEVPDLHHDFVDISPFEIDLKFEFDAPQYFDFLQEANGTSDSRQPSEGSSHDEWFDEHHSQHEAASSIQKSFPAKRRCPVIPHLDKSAVPIEKLLAEHNKKVREENLLKVKCRKAVGNDSSIKSPTKINHVTKRKLAIPAGSPSRKFLKRKSAIEPRLSQSPNKSRLSRRSVIVSSTLTVSPRRSKILRRSAITIAPTGNSRSKPKKPPRSFTSKDATQSETQLEKSTFIPEAKGLTIRTQEASTVSASQNRDVPSALKNKRTRIELSICPPDPNASKGKGNSIPKRPRSGKENFDDITEMLALHNEKFKTKPVYVPRQHSTKDVRLWEKMSGKIWYELDPEQRQIANQEITNMKNDQSSGINRSGKGHLDYLCFPR